VKCFVAGARWGLTLAPAALATRGALAAALGRGDRLHVVFVDEEGRISEFPPRAEAGWKTAAASSERVYVRQDSPAR